MKRTGRRVRCVLAVLGVSALGCSAGLLVDLDEKEFEASGVVRVGDALCFVDDHTPGVYFRVELERPTGVIELTESAAERAKLKGRGLAQDLEGIEVRGDEVFVLSEELRLLIGSEKTTYQYGAEFAPGGNRGLEGIAFSPDAKRAAALWEGGYLAPDKLPRRLRAPLVSIAPQPQVVLHDLPREGKDRRQKGDDSARVVELLVGQIPLRLPASSGVSIEPGQRFRGADLVWNTAREDELIVLLGSTSQPGKPKRFGHTWLQRFDLDGRPLGVPFDVKAWLRSNGHPELANENWEGLAWWEPVETLVLVNDAGRDGKTYAAFVPVSIDWLDPPAADVPRAVALHRDALVFDGHNDLPWALRDMGVTSFDELDISKPQPDLHTDISRLRAGNVGAQFWSVYVPAETEAAGTAAHETLEQIDVVHRMLRRYPDVFELALDADDIERIHREGRIASMLGIEGGYSIEDSLALLRVYRDLGVRYITLTHANTTSWADAATDDAVHGGLSTFGEDVVREMNRLGMLVDISHVSVETMKDALRVSRAPIIASHSNAFTVAPHVRNVPDDVLELVKQNRGVVMINFFSGFVVRESAVTAANMFDAWRDLRAEHADDDAFEAAFAKWREEHPLVPGTVSDVVDHIDHIVSVAGIDCVGLGSDFDGVTLLPAGLEDVSCYPAITRELLERGYSEGDVRKVLGLNALRALREAESVARALSR